MTKKIISSAILLTLLAGCNEKNSQKADYAVISGKVALPENQKVQLIQDNQVIKEIPVASDGTFRDTIRALSENHFYYLFENPSLLLPIYLDKGTHLELALNQDLSKVNLLSGIQSDQTKYLIEKTAFANSKIFRSDGELFKQEPQEFKKNLKTYFSELEAKLKSYNLDENFVKSQQKWIKYKQIECLMDYPSSYNYFLGKDPVLPTDFYTERDAIDFDNAQEYDTEESYRDLVQRKYYEQLGDASNPEQLEHFIQIVSALKSENIRADFGKSMAPLINPNNPKNKIILDFVLNNIKEEKIRQVVQDIYDQSERLASEKPSPVFNNYENAKGGTTSLSDLKGKFVYVDVWATWCRPCIGEIPVLKELQNKFKGKNIEFVSISVDENREAWLKMIKEKELKGVQLLSDKSFDSQFVREYGITEIPVFILLDKEGKIINANAPRPSDPEIEKILENLIK